MKGKALPCPVSIRLPGRVSTKRMTAMGNSDVSDTCGSEAAKSSAWHPLRFDPVEVLVHSLNHCGSSARKVTRLVSNRLREFLQGTSSGMLYVRCTNSVPPFFDSAPEPNYGASLLIIHARHRDAMQEFLIQTSTVQRRRACRAAGLLELNLVARRHHQAS
jgi:hypothetical protein